MTGTKKQNRRVFASPQYQDFTIKDKNGTVGHLRIKPNAILWKGKHQQKFYQVTLDEFGKFAEEKGKQVTN